MDSKPDHKTMEEKCNFLHSGVYRKVKSSGHGRGTGIGELYQLIGPAREHFSGASLVVYIPLRIEPEWAGTVRMCVIGRNDFDCMFEFVGEGLPTASDM
jgi:hypothetical protein